MLSCLFNHNRINQREALVVFAYKDIHSFNAARTYTLAYFHVSPKDTNRPLSICVLYTIIASFYT